MKKLFIIAALILTGLMTSVCTEHRETKTEIFNDNQYLNKEFLTRPNPNHFNEAGDQDEYGWLMGLNVTAVSVPTPLPDIFPGLQGTVQYVRFAFSQDTMQIRDAIVPGPWGEDGADENLGSPLEQDDLAPRIVQEYEGSHLDIQLRKNMDGEVSNYIEEFKERDWEDRQFFKTQLENGAFSDMSKLDWYYDWALSGAMELRSASMVPDSLRYVDTIAHESNFGDDDQVDWDKGDYIEWKVRLTYWIDVRYSSLMNYRAGTDTQTIDIKYSFWRRSDVEDPANEYVARPVGEKDKYVKQFGIWNTTIQNYQDPETGLIGAQTYLERFNPNLPIDYYMINVPQEYLDVSPITGTSLYDSVAKSANAALEQAGVEARVAFHDVEEDGIIREFGDIRYSFVNWHNNMFTDIPWLGYGPSLTDPRTGEIFNATLNFNNWMGLHYYTFIVKDIIEQTSGVENPFEDTKSCKSGDRRKIFNAHDEEELENSKFHNSTLFTKMISYMEQEPKDWVLEHTDKWYDYYHMLQQDLRFFYPPYQNFVYSGRELGTEGLHDTREEMIIQDKEFWDIAAKLEEPGGPAGIMDYSSEGSIEKTLEFINRAKESMSAHHRLNMDRQVAAGMHGICLLDGPTLLSTVQQVSQKCVDDKWQTFDEWEDDMRWRITHQTSVHELGHNLGQWHNFAGSMDAKHYQTVTNDDGKVVGHGASSSVMDYVHHFSEVGADLGYYPYDIATLIYGYRYDSQEAVDEETDKTIVGILHPEWVDGTHDGEKDISKSYLFANDYHRPLSPFVETFDLGTTPTEIVYNHIQYYDFQYKFRNFRSFRQYWETWSYPNRAFASTFPLRRFLDLWFLDWYGSDLENDLRLLGVDGDLFFFDNIRDEFTQEMGQANRMIVNFYRAILTQSNAERSYSTTYDSYFGDVTRIGIIYDKFYSMLSFLGLWGADNYNWDVYALLAYYEANNGNFQYYSDAMETVTTMLGGDYDVYPWFLPSAVAVFAQDTSNINFGDQTMKEWIGFRGFERDQDMVDYYGFDPRYQCMEADGTIDGTEELPCATAALGAQDEGHQTFYDSDGGQWVYLFIWDRNLHLCASVDLSPISYKMIWDYNEDINIDNRDWATTYTIKYFYDYYKWFN
jgi:Met-zincin